MSNWDADFEGLPPIKLPDGRKLERWLTCRAYILALPSSRTSSLGGRSSRTAEGR